MTKESTTALIAARDRWRDLHEDADALEFMRLTMEEGLDLSALTSEGEWYELGSVTGRHLAKLAQTHHPWLKEKTPPS